jgi:predicted dehydrogenase
MKVLIVGLGSIAKKHLGALWEIYPAAKVYALRHQPNAAAIAGVVNIYKNSEIPKDLDFAIIANPTSKHQETLESLLFLNIPFFIEKPLFSNLLGKQSLLNKIKESSLVTYVACNLRFHPAIIFLQEKMKQKKPIEMSVYCGSYLPDWRPGTDYRKNYSAIKGLGGGVDLDLIHEVDYTLYLLGKPQHHSRYVAKKSALEIDTHDIAHYVLEYKHSSAFITLNYYRKTPKRTIEIVWEDAIWEVDLLNSTIIDQQGHILFQEEFQIKDTYVTQLKYFIDCLKAGKPPMNDIDEAYETIKITLNE